MASTMHDEVTRLLDAQAKSIDDLHQKLSAAVGANKEKLQAAVEKYKAAHKQFHDDAQEFMN